MKNLVFLAAFLFALAFTACKNKKADSATTTDTDSSTLVIDYGSVQVDSISPDSAQVTVSDTTVVIQ